VITDIDARAQGYIRPGEKLNGVSVRAVQAFVEKPDATTAASYVTDRCLWNSGNFLFHAATMAVFVGRVEERAKRGSCGGAEGSLRVIVIRSTLMHP
jgi:mannose-1-phosphate guanylyltransferase